MKRTVFFITIFLLMIPGGFAQYLQIDRVAEAPKAALMKEFPQAMNQMWTLEGSTWHVWFMQGETKYSMKFDDAGNWIDKETRIALTALPKEITKSIARNCAGFSVYEAEKVDSPD